MFYFVLEVCFELRIRFKKCLQVVHICIERYGIIAVGYFTWSQYHLYYFFAVFSKVFYFVLYISAYIVFHMFGTQEVGGSWKCIGNGFGDCLLLVTSKWWCLYLLSSVWCVKGKWSMRPSHCQHVTSWVLALLDGLSSLFELQPFACTYVRQYRNKAGVQIESFVYSNDTLFHSIAARTRLS